MLGSRYVPGGGTANWGLVAAPHLARRLALRARRCSACRIRDLTGGFKCYRRAVLETHRPRRVHSKGYAFQIETTYRTLRAGLHASSRSRSASSTAPRATSKMSRAIVLEAIWQVPALRLAALAGRL